MSLQQYIESTGGLTQEDLIFLATVGIRGLLASSEKPSPPEVVPQPDQQPADDEGSNPPARSKAVTPLQREVAAQMVATYCTHRAEIDVAAIECGPQDGYHLFFDGCSDATYMECYAVTKSLENVREWATSAGRKSKFVSDSPTNAAALTPDQSFDFVCFGSLGDEADAVEAIEAWHPKLRSTGFMFGGSESRSAAMRIAGELVQEYADNGAWFVKVAHLRDRKAASQEESDG